MKWYDYIVCVILAQNIARPLFDVVQAQSVWWAIFSAVAAYGYIIFEWYAECRLGHQN